ncbi:hypothetical protein Scep_016769 [Stephania cephalantha]|uniref:Uncharacterized protein n=1 Tax=Stephania cephalantha TaxID=152367 RepID=A0AAP0NW88_9MAGN
MSATGTRGGRRRPQTPSYRKSKQLERVTDPVDVATSSTQSSRSSDSSEEQWVHIEQGNVVEGNENKGQVGELEREKKRLQERENQMSLIRDKKRGLESENLRVLNRGHGRKIQRNLLGEKKRGMEREERIERVSHLREPMKMGKKGHVTRHRVRRVVDVVQKWKALPASESTMTSAEKMADDVLRHLTGKG